MKGTRTDRLWVFGGVIAAFVILALAWFLALSPMLSATASVNGQTTDARFQTARLQHKISQLKAESANKSSLQRALITARDELPTADGLSAFTRQLQQQSVTAHVSLTQITVGTPTAASGGTTGAATPASTTVNPAGHLYAIPVSIGVTGSLSQTAEFVDLLQHHGTRAALLSNAQVSGSTDKSSAMALSLQVSLFAAPQTPAAEAALQQLTGSGS
jgi:Tfp pilus assembly protein PilO